MKPSTISALTNLLKGPSSVVSEAKKKKEDPVESSFDDFVKVLKKEFGKDAILHTESNTQILKVVMCKEKFLANQLKFELKGREPWLEDNGMAILSVIPQNEPESYKIYFCRIQTLNSPE